MSSFVCSRCAKESEEAIRAGSFGGFVLSLAALAGGLIGGWLCLIKIEGLFGIISVSLCFGVLVLIGVVGIIRGLIPFRQSYSLDTEGNLHRHSPSDEYIENGEAILCTYYESENCQRIHGGPILVVSINALWAHITLHRGHRGWKVWMDRYRNIRLCSHYSDEELILPCTQWMSIETPFTRYTKEKVEARGLDLSVLKRLLKIVHCQPPDSISVLLLPQGESDTIPMPASEVG